MTEQEQERERTAEALEAREVTFVESMKPLLFSGKLDHLSAGEVRVIWDAAWRVQQARIDALTAELAAVREAGDTRASQIANASALGWKAERDAAVLETDTIRVELAAVREEASDLRLFLGSAYKMIQPEAEQPRPSPSPGFDTSLPDDHEEVSDA